MALVDVVMSVDGGDHFNDLDISRLKEMWENYSSTHQKRTQFNTFEHMMTLMESALRDHVRRHQTWFGCRPIWVRAVTQHYYDEFDRQVVILPQRATWAAVNHGFDYLHRQTQDARMDQDYDSMIRHWAGDNLAKYLDVHGGFSRFPGDRQDCFNLIQVLEVSKRYTYNREDTVGSKFEVDTPHNLQNQRENEMLFLVIRSKPMPG